jgi:tripartite-type tricarboxylate transporter receptor subunit TctC
LLAAAVTFALSGNGFAQEAFPSRAITIVNPNAPGGFVDNVGRGLALAMQKFLKQPVLIVNRPGANGSIGTVAVANAAPDGYTLLLSSPSFPTQPAIDELFERPAAYQVAKFVPVAQITSDPAIFMVHPGVGVKTIQEFIARARAQPDGLVVASSGTYGATHLPVAMLEIATGIRLRHVPTSGGAPAMTMALGGHANAVASAPSVAFAQVQANRLVALAQSGARRLPSFADVPTFREAGIDLEFALWTSLFAPAATPPAALRTIAQAVRQAVQDEQFRGSMNKGNSAVAYMDGDEYAAAFRADMKKLQDTVRHIGKVADTAQ